MYHLARSSLAGSLDVRGRVGFRKSASEGRNYNEATAHAASGMAGDPLDVFISYSRKDEALKDELARHLKILRREGKINTWQDRDIEAGTEWAGEIKAQLEKAQIILLLVTSNFLASDYCYETEMQRAVQRHHAGTARVIPIILKPCSWQYSDFKELQALPKDGKPVTSWRDREEAFFDIEIGIRRVIDSIHAEYLFREQEAARQQAIQQQQQAEAARQERERQAEQKRQQEQAVAEQLRREREIAERERQQQATAERRKREQAALEKQRQAAQALEDERRAAATATERMAQQRQRAARAKNIQQITAKQRPIGQINISRRRALQIAGFGGGGLAIAVAANSLMTQPSRRGEVIFPKPPPVVGDGPDDLSEISVETVTVNDKGSIIERPSGQVNAFRQDLGNGVGLEMVSIPAGEFVMGSPDGEIGRNEDEGPQRTVTVPAFFMGRFTITQAQYQAVMGQNPSRFQENGTNRPVEQVTWDDAVAFCERLSQQTGRTYRLPSEAEWEYACRAGTDTPFHFGPTLTPDLANYNDNYTYGSGPKGKYREQTTALGNFPPNAFGLYDMHGNVWEWCQDVWHVNYEGAPTDGSAWAEGGNQEWRILRGGSWDYSPDACRSASRLHVSLANIALNVGFRVVWVLA
ncbi:MAG: SUMF1/EgtB/PvdO family nonheme iron enzyme [Leptolyngbya sp. SIO1D8]|nr:SUMF1/EgtB/PvdO family nonheme iron enzyme [Leptolyngbya sp. SIO1D8]